MNYKILITCVSSFIFAIIIASLWAGIVMREATVVDHPYEDGLKYEATQKRYAELGWKIVVPAALDKDGKLRVLVCDRNGAPMDVGMVELAINRLGGHETAKYLAVRADRGKYSALVDVSAKGYWEVRVKLTRGSDVMIYDDRIHIDG